MSLPVSVVNTVNITVGGSFPQRAGFGTYAFFTESSAADIYLDQVSPIRYYGNVQEVTDEWGATSNEAIAATTYFSQSPSPTSFAIANRFSNGGKSLLQGSERSVGGKLSDASQELGPLIEFVDNGQFQVTLNDASKISVLAMNFQSVTTNDELVNVINTACQTADSNLNCYYKRGRLVLQYSDTSKSIVSVEALDTPTDPAGSYAGKRLGIGFDSTVPEAPKTFEAFAPFSSVSGALSYVENFSSDWYFFGFTKFVRGSIQQVKDAADWAEARRKIFATVTQESAVLEIQPIALGDDGYEDQSIAHYIYSKGFKRTHCVYSSFLEQYPEVSAMARMATVDLNNANSSITLAYKEMPSISPEGLTTSQEKALASIRCNVYTNIIGTPNYLKGYMGAEGVFIDETHGLDWLNDAINVNLFGALRATTTKIPYTDGGVAVMEQQLKAALDEAVNNGLAAAGTTQSGEYLSLGYKITTTPVASANQSDKEGRYYRSLSFTLIGAGALHGVEVQGIYER